MTLRRLLVLPLLLMAALLVGCGDDSDASDTGTSSERGSERDQADDEQESEDRDDAVGTDDFTFVPPEGWADISDEPTVARAEIAYRSDEPVNGFAANVNVIKTAGQKMSVADLEEAGIAELEAGGFADVRADDPYEVDGEESPVVSAVASQQGITYQTRQYYAQYDDSYFIITFSFSPDVDEDEVVEVSESIIDSWRWES